MCPGVTTPGASSIVWYQPGLAATASAGFKRRTTFGARLKSRFARARRPRSRPGTGRARRRPRSSARRTRTSPPTRASSTRSSGVSVSWKPAGEVVAVAAVHHVVLEDELDPVPRRSRPASGGGPSRPTGPGSRSSAPRAGRASRCSPALPTRMISAQTRTGSRTSSSVCEQTTKSNWSSSNGSGSAAQTSRWTHVSALKRSSPPGSRPYSPRVA